MNYTLIAYTEDSSYHDRCGDLITKLDLLKHSLLGMKQSLLKNGQIGVLVVTMKV